MKELANPDRGREKNESSSWRARLGTRPAERVFVGVWVCVGV